MNKFYTLITNEMIKISRKISILVILILIVVGMIGFGGIMKIQQISMNRYSNEYPGEEDWRKEESKSELDFLKKELAGIESRILEADDAEKEILLFEKRRMESRIKYVELGIELDIHMYASGYRSEILNNLVNISNDIVNAEESLKKFPDNQDIVDEYDRLKNLESSYLKILEDNDFEEYIELKINETKNDSYMQQAEKDIYIEGYELWLKIDPEGNKSTSERTTGYSDPIKSTIDTISQMKISLLYNIESSYSWGASSRPLSPQGREKIENDIAVMMYKLENDITGTSDYNSGYFMAQTAMSGMTGLGQFLVIILILILAGGTVSQEISSGSIKSLIISPTKRYKIFFAKLVSLIFVGVVSTLFVYIIAIPVHGIYFGFSQMAPYVYAVNGVASELNFYLYSLASGFVDYLDIAVYMMLALMLSVITRNTAVSVGVSVAIYFGGNIVNSFISIFASGEWMKFIPFNNMSLSSRVFPQAGTDIGLAGMMGNNLRLPSVTFSLIYLTVLFICLGYIALDSFNRRDIK